MDPATLQLLAQYGLPLVGLVMVVRWVKGKVDQAQVSHMEEKTRLITRLDEKDAKIEEKSSRIENVLTQTVQQNTAAHVKHAQVLEEFSETLRTIPCMQASSSERKSQG